MTARASRGRPLAVRAPGWLGDFVMALPALRAIDLAWSAAGGRHALLAPARFLDLARRELPGFEPRPVDRGETAGHYAGAEVALFLNGSFRSVFHALLAGVELRVGLASGGRGLLLTDPLGPLREVGLRPPGLGRTSSFGRALPRPFGSTCIELAGLLGVEVPARAPSLAIDPAARERAREAAAAVGVLFGRPFALLNAGGRAGSTKAYPVEGWARCARALAQATGEPVLVVAGPGEEPRAEEVTALAEHPLVRRTDAAPGLAELAALQREARVFLTADSGPRHLAAAVGAPQVVVLGPTDPRHSAEHTALSALLREPVPCGPCHRELCPLPAPRHHACMTSLEPERVARAALGVARR